MNGFPEDEGRSLSMCTIYDHPLDCPTHYVMRQTVIRPSGSISLPLATIAEDIEVLRTLCRTKGLVCIPRSEGDDPVIVETWA